MPAGEAPPVQPTPETAPEETPVNEHLDYLWNCYVCAGNTVWNFIDGQAHLMELPIQMGVYFGYAPATGRILYGTPLEAMGGGPSSIAVTDLWAYHVATGNATPFFSEQTIVEAEWAPDGEQFAYILATDTTYELRWRGLAGEDKLLAPDVTFTFSISPDGSKVAFTRESNYRLPGEPGLYVVDVATATEIKISDADRAGAGDIADKPVWSPSGSHVFLPTAATTGGPGMVRAAADGSNTVILGFDSSLSEEAWYQAEPFSPMWISETQFIASAFVPGMSGPMGGPTNLVLYQLDDTLDTIMAGAILGEGMLIGWDVPGESIWMLGAEGMESVPLPAL
jgi:hypothetical protein